MLCKKEIPYKVDFRYNVVKIHIKVRNHLIFTQKYLRKCEDTYFILRNKYLHMYEDSFGVKMLLKNKIQKYYLSKLLLENYLVYI